MTVAERFPFAGIRSLLLSSLLTLSTAVAVHAQSFEDGLAAAQQGDPVTAIAIWTPLAESGQPEAQFWLAESFWGGWWGGTENLERRAHWHMRAAEQGYAPSFVKLGHMYADGHHFAKDDEAAARWYVRAAEADNADGQYALGNSYFNGNGVTLDRRKAYGLWRQAAAQGHEGARLALCEETTDLCAE